MHIETTVRHYLTPTRTVAVIMIKIVRSVGKEVGQLEPLRTAVGNVKIVQLLWKIVAAPQNFKQNYSRTQ